MMLSAFVALILILLVLIVLLSLLIEDVKTAVENIDVHIIVGTEGCVTTRLHARSTTAVSVGDRTGGSSQDAQIEVILAVVLLSFALRVYQSSILVITWSERRNKQRKCQ
uniref:Secreted protein n=1 Tax=Echinococcus granulosus TaxID=6210 RepID=A0A7E4ZEL6_ECHGR